MTPQLFVSIPVFNKEKTILNVLAAIGKAILVGHEILGASISNLNFKD